MCHIWLQQFKTSRQSQPVWGQKQSRHALLTVQEAQEDEDDSISDRKLSCVIYRSSQKRIAREYLIRAQQELAKEMVKLKQLADKA